jgi:hypothetical protein
MAVSFAWVFFGIASVLSVFLVLHAIGTLLWLLFKQKSKSKIVRSAAKFGVIITAWKSGQSNLLSTSPNQGIAILRA